MRRILALGGGGFLMEDTASPIDDYLLHLTGKAKPRICFLPTPSGDLPEHIEAFYRAFPRNRCEPSHLAFFRKASEGALPLASFHDLLCSQDVVFIGGGNTKSALAVWREWGVDQALVHAYQAGVLVSGMSAGAMCWFEAGFTDSFGGSGYRRLPGLSFLAGGCAVHYSSNPERRRLLHAAIASSTMPATVAIDDFAAVLYQDSATPKAVSWRTGATAYSVSRLGHVAHEVPYVAESIGGEESQSPTSLEPLR